jgi:hypothetical protein
VARADIPRNVYDLQRFRHYLRGLCHERAYAVYLCKMGRPEIKERIRGLECLKREAARHAR